MLKEDDNLLEDTIGMSGNMGKVIALFRLYRETGEENWKMQAEELLDTIWEEYGIHSSLAYGSGLCGLGVGIEYLIQNNFVEGNADEILLEIDVLVINLIDSRPPLDLNVETGILGLACYLYYRLCYRKTSEIPVVLSLKVYVIHLIDWIADAMQDRSVNQNHYEVYFILVLLHRLDILNAKIENLIDWCDKTLLTLKN